MVTSLALSARTWKARALVNCLRATLSAEVRLLDAFGDVAQSVDKLSSFLPMSQ